MSNTTITKPRLRGFGLRNLRTMPGREGPAHDALITYNGRNVGNTHNDGGGGSDYRHFTDADAKAAFEALAEDLYPGGIENGDHVVGDMLETIKFNRKRGTVFVKAGVDPWDYFSPNFGDVMVLGGPKGDAANAQIARDYPGARIWNRDAEDFVAI